MKFLLSALFCLSFMQTADSQEKKQIIMTDLIQFPIEEVVKVTNLEDSGEGSLRDCIEKKTARLCIFTVSGKIKLNDALKIKFPRIVIAGQTAPEPGISIVNAGIKIETPDVYIQHLQIRVGDHLGKPAPESRDGISIGSNKQIVKNVWLKNLSVSWAVDENLGVWYEDTNKIRISDSIFSESLNNSIHPKGPHSKGILVGDGCQNIAISRNILAHNFERNPYFKPGSSGEFVNNLVYNWGNRGGHNIANLSDAANTGDPIQVSFIGNFFQPGLDSIKAPPIHARPLVDKSKIYIKDNIGSSRSKDTDDESAITNFKDAAVFVDSPPFPLQTFPIMPVRDSYEYLLKNAGSRPKNRNIVDRRIIKEIQQHSGHIKDCIQGCKLAAGEDPLVISNTRVLAVPEDKSQDSLNNWIDKYSKEVLVD